MQGRQGDGSKGVVLASEQNVPRQVMFSTFVVQPELRRLPARANFNILDMVVPAQPPRVIVNPFVPVPIPANSEISPAYCEALRYSLAVALVDEDPNDPEVAADYARWERAREAQLRRQGKSIYE